MTKALKDVPQECKKGIVSAINRSVKSTNTAMQRAVTERYRITKGQLNGKGGSSKSQIKLVFASSGKLEAGIQVRSTRMALDNSRGFISPKAPKSRKGKTMQQIKRLALPTVSVIKGQRTRFPHAFVAQGKGGTTGIFTRDGKKSYPVSMRHTMSPSNMVRYPAVVKKTDKAAKEALEKNVAHEIEYRLGRLAK